MAKLAKVAWTQEEFDLVIFLQGPAAQTFLFLLVAALAIIAGGAIWRSRKKSAI